LRLCSENSEKKYFFGCGLMNAEQAGARHTTEHATAARADDNFWIASMPAGMARHIDEVESRGYTIIPGVFPPDLCERAANHVDRVLDAQPPDDRGETDSGSIPKLRTLTQQFN
jgi:hypothetical protein